ncbi:HdeA/HdeB family chaperone [Methylovirgula sp. HY1]|jgi:hypothetical protein|uniref:HdeA/HdeB family chaperone n=1 Tax=Methylovirgula sp. HY1 TaxID=2822761 RepID=UPI001C5B5113|nr:HdeA/HdeB family chaperone [Methylovirgula sp. HY1]QXX75238.1 hypothetical protein MHY1_02057 [Methylovirgula sp. HY1]
MKLRFVTMPIVTLVATLAAVPGRAENLDFSQIKCSDFVAGTKDDAVLMLTWLEGYFTKKSGRPTMNSAKASKDGKGIRDYCLAHGDDDVFKAAKTVMSVK